MYIYIYTYIDMYHKNEAFMQVNLPLMDPMDFDCFFQTKDLWSPP